MYCKISIIVIAQLVYSYACCCANQKYFFLYMGANWGMHKRALALSWTKNIKNL